MRSYDMLEAIGGIDPELIKEAERPILVESPVITEMKRADKRGRRIAACIIGALCIVAIFLHTFVPGIPFILPLADGTSDSVFKYSYSWHKKENASFDAEHPSYDVMGAEFEIGSILEVSLIEVLEEGLRMPDRTYPGKVARLKVIDEIVGEGFPEEICLYFEGAKGDELLGYDSFIMSLEQIGSERYPLINDEDKTVRLFDNMFTVRCNYLHYGGVIAFKDNAVSRSFRNDGLHAYDYPAAIGDSVDAVKERILAANYEEKSYRSLDYLGSEEIFSGDEAREIKDYLLDPDSIFYHDIYFNPSGVVITYERLINGIPAGEAVMIRYDGGKEVKRIGNSYSEKQLERVPDLNRAMESIGFKNSTPPRILLSENIIKKGVEAKCFYRSIGGRTYGILRVTWTYTSKVAAGANIYDELYYLWTDNGIGCRISRGSLRLLLGDNDNGVTNTFDRNWLFSYIVPFEDEIQRLLYGQ